MLSFLKRPFLDENIRKTLSVVSLLSAIGLAVAAMLVPPYAVIDASVLWFTSQMLVFISGLLGINMTVDFGKRRLETKVKTGSEKTEPEESTDK